MTVCFDAPVLSPVIVCEHTATGWRGLTEDGEILNVHTHVNGSPVLIPENLAVSYGGEIVGHRLIDNEACEGVIDDYVEHLDAATALLRRNDSEEALAEIDAALVCARTVLARYNRAMILLHLGRWREGFEELAHCEQTSPLFMRPQWARAMAAGLAPWRGEDLAGKKLLLIHDHGFGDTIMMLRHALTLRAMGTEVVLQVPSELERLAAQVVPVTRELVDADYVCSILMLMGHLDSGMPCQPYLKVDASLRDKWREYLGHDERKRIGIAWSVGVESKDDYPRSIPRYLMIEALKNDGNIISIQQQGQFEDFADCAALMSLMDEIVTVDTAAVHLAGAIGHPRITLLLSHWASWRWQLPLYQNLRVCRQASPGDWESALAARRSAE